MDKVEQRLHFLIHFELPDGSEDCIDVFGDTIEEIQRTAMREVHERIGTNPWSEEAQ
jgi:hypothetical protein